MGDCFLVLAIPSANRPLRARLLPSLKGEVSPAQAPVTEGSPPVPRFIANQSDKRAVEGASPYDAAGRFPLCHCEPVRQAGCRGRQPLRCRRTFPLMSLRTSPTSGLSRAPAPTMQPDVSPCHIATPVCDGRPSACAAERHGFQSVAEGDTLIVHYSLFILHSSLFIFHFSPVPSKHPWQRRKKML